MAHTKQDRARVAGGQDHEVRYEGGKTGASKSEVSRPPCRATFHVASEGKLARKLATRETLTAGEPAATTFVERIATIHPRKPFLVPPRALRSSFETLPAEPAQYAPRSMRHGCQSEPMDPLAAVSGTTKRFPVKIGPRARRRTHSNSGSLTVFTKLLNQLHWTDFLSPWFADSGPDQCYEYRAPTVSSPSCPNRCGCGLRRWPYPPAGPGC